MSPLHILLTLSRINGTLAIEGDQLRVSFPRQRPELMAAIRRHKPALIELLRLNFLLVRSSVLNSFLFWVPDHATKAALVRHGAHPGSIYTAAELSQLLNRRLSFAELLLLHAAKHRFHATIGARPSPGALTWPTRRQRGFPLASPPRVPSNTADLRKP